jgi:hypothetical protein
MNAEPVVASTANVNVCKTFSKHWLFVLIRVRQKVNDLSVRHKRSLFTFFPSFLQ